MYSRGSGHRRRDGIVAVLALLAATPVAADTEWQIRPFGGITVGGGTTWVDLDHAVGRPNIVLGVSGGMLGEVIGIEVDVARAPGYFQGGDRSLPADDPLRDNQLVAKSNVTTITGNVIVGLPRRVTEYTLRPYFVGGFGLMRARTYDSFNSLQVNMSAPAIDLGGGVFGSFSERTGISWELRHFRSIRGKVEPLTVLAQPAKLSFWRGNMALVIRF
jgi:hypothetical protein